MVDYDAFWDLCSMTTPGVPLDPLVLSPPPSISLQTLTFYFWDEVSARAYWTYAGDWCRVLCLKQLGWMVLDLAIKTYSPHRLSVLGMVWHSIFSLLSVVSLKCWFTWHWQEKKYISMKYPFCFGVGKKWNVLSNTISKVSLITSTVKLHVW